MDFKRKIVEVGAGTPLHAWAAVPGVNIPGTSGSKENKRASAGSLSLKLIWLSLCILLLFCILLPLLFVFLTPSKSDFFRVFTSPVFGRAAMNTLFE